MKRGLCLLCSTFLSVAALACASESGNADGEEGGSGAPDTGSTGGNPGVGDPGASTGGSVLKADETGGNPNPGDTEVTDEESCTGLALEPESIEVEEEITTTVETEVPAPVALYIVLDNSTSMEQVGATESKWEEAVSAFTSFVEDPASEGIDVAIQYFHPPGAGRDVDECDGVAHATPAVEMGTLPEQAPAIVSSLESTGAVQGTPTFGALLGATDYCTAFQADHPDEKCVVILVTDGEPNGCGLNGATDAASQLTPIAEAGLGSGVVTFTVGMAGVTEAGFTLLDQIAIAGGSDCTPDAAGDEACDVSTSGPEGLLAALNAIRDSVTVVETHTETITTTEVITLPCEWTLPEPPEGETLDPMLVNVSIIDAATTPALYVPSAADCELAAGPAWYYDDPVAPTKMYVCPATCELLSATPTASVQVVLGCERIQVIL